MKYTIVGTAWPDGWEPNAPLDVPNCLVPVVPAAEAPLLDYSEAVAVMRGLNQQSMDQDAARWYVIYGCEVAMGKPERFQLVRPERGNRGDCSYCPAHDFPCAEGAR